MNRETNTTRGPLTDELVEPPMADVLGIIVLTLLLSLETRYWLGTLGGCCLLLWWSAVDGWYGLLSLGCMVAGSLVVGWSVVFSSSGACRDDVGSSLTIGECNVGFGCCWPAILHICGLKDTALEGWNGWTTGRCEEDIL